MSINGVSLGEFSRRDVVADPKVPDANPYKHLVGIELELENVRMEKAMNPSWIITEDQSLRDGLEFVSNGPHNGLKLKQHIRAFYDAGVKWKNSPRTSTHIHVNVSDCSIETARAMFIISYMLEEALFLAINVDRKFCGYCMPLSEMSPHRIRRFLTTTSRNDFLMQFQGNNADKYYGFNINSINKHGTVEFRYFPGGPTEEQLLDWVLYCTEVKSAALASGLNGLLALDTPELLRAWLYQHFPRWADTLLVAQGINDIHALYQEAISYLPEQQGVVRRDPLVFVNEELIQMIGRMFLKTPEKTKMLRDMTLKLEVMTHEEWFEIVNRCRREADMEAKEERAKKREEEQFAEMVRMQQEYQQLQDRMRARAQAVPPPQVPGAPRPVRYR
jgi:hypothetical protein